jgi:PAS domain S-box-containing protein
MSIPLRVLMVEDSETDAGLVLRQMYRAGYKVVSRRVETAAEMQLALDEQPGWDIITVDYSLPVFDAPLALSLVQKNNLDVPVIIITGEIDEERAVALMKAGAHDYLHKQNLARLAPVLERELRQTRLRREHQAAELAVREGEQRYRSLFQQASEGIFITDGEGNYIDVNQSGCQMSGYSLEELLKMNLLDLAPLEDLHLGVVDSTMGTPFVHRRMKCKDGSLLDIELSAKMQPNGHIQGVARDISGRKRVEAALRRMNRVYALISHVNQMVVHARDSRELFANLCRIAVEAGGFRMAWLGLVEESRQAVRPVHWYGEELGYLEMIKEISVSDSPAGRGPTGSAIRSKQTYFCNDIANDPVMQVWGDEALARGYRSSIALPVVVREKVIGAFMMYAGEPFFFNPDEVSLLENLMENVDYALEMLENDRQRINTEEKLQETLQELNFHIGNSPLAVVQFNGDLRVTSWSGRAEEMFGWSEAEVLGQDLARLGWFNKGGLDVLKSQVVSRSIFTLRNFRKNGTAIICQWYNSALLDMDGKLISLRSQVLDISEQARAEEGLRESEEKFRRLMEQSPSGILMLDQLGKVIEWNQALEKITGLKRKDVLGISGWEVQKRILPLQVQQSVDEEFHQRRILELLKTGMPLVMNQRLDNEVISADGTRRWVDISAFVISMADGNRTVAIVNDVSERKKAESALKDNATQLDLVFNSSSDAQILYRVLQDDRFVIQMINRACIEQIGLEFPELADQLTGLERAEFLRVLKVPEIDIAEGLARYQAVRDRQQVIQHETAYQSPLGEKVLDITLVPVLDQQGVCSHILRTARDVTESRKNQRELFEINQRFSNAFEYAPNGMTLTSLDGNWIKVNRALCDMLGYSEEELLNINFRQITHPDDMVRNMELNQRLNSGELNSFQMQKRNFHKSGRIVWVMLSVSMVRDDQGQPLYHIAQISNITELVQAEETLRLQRTALMNVSSAIVVTDPNLTIEWANPAWTELTGYSLAESIGKTHQLIRSGVHDQSFYDELERTLLAGNNWRGELTNRRKDGQLYTEQVSYTPVLDDLGEVLHIVAIRQDISERKQIEETLRQNEASLREAQKIARTGSWEWDLRTNLVIWSEEMYRVFDLDPKTYDGRPESLMKVIHPDDVEIYLDAVSTNKESGDKPVLEYRVVHRDGSIHFVYGEGRMMLDQDGKPLKSIGTVQDVTERRQAENALRESETRFKDILFSMGDWVWEVDEHGVYTFSSERAVDYFGSSAEDIIGKTPFDFMPREEVERVAPIFYDMTMRKAPIRNMENWNVKKNGELICLLTNGVPILDKDGNLRGYRGVAQDITERKRAEEALRKAHGELEQRVEERTGDLRDANLALEKAARLKDEFLASMSHELRTPLTGILGLSEALQMVTYGELNEKQRRALKNIEMSGRHLLALINDILDLSKIEAGKFELQIDACSLGEICQNSLQLTRGMAAQKHQQVNFQMIPASINLRADARRLKQMIVNLMGNAIKFTPDGGRLGIEVNGDENQQLIQITIWDEGIGIRAEDFTRLFKPFTQLDSSLSRQYSGTGLGLSLVQRLAELHGGRVDVESSPGMGSRFTIMLPWREVVGTSGQLVRLPGTGALVFAGDKNMTKGGTAPLVAEGKNAPLVAVTDDNEIVLEILSDFLVSRKFRVELALSGQEFLDKLEHMIPDVVLMDIQMPGMSGLEVIRRIRAHPNPVIANLPVIAITALAMYGDRERCLEAGANEYISKPVQLRELLQMIRSIGSQST